MTPTRLPWGKNGLPTSAAGAWNATSSQVSLPLKTRLTRSSDDNCMTCHMPGSGGTDIAHVATTDHRVLRNPENQTASQAADRGRRSAATAQRLPIGVRGGGFAGTGTGNRFDIRRRGTSQYTIRKATRPPRPEAPDKALAERPDDLEVSAAGACTGTCGAGREAIELQQQILKLAPSYEQVLEIVQYTIELRDYRPALAPAAKAVCPRSLVLRPA